MENKTNGKTLTQLYIEAENARKDLNAALLSDKFSEIETAKKVFDKAIADHNAEAIINDYATLRSSSTPMLTAIEQLNIETIEGKPNKDKETGFVTYSVEKAKRQISLTKFDEFCGREKMSITPDPLWEHKVNRFCLLITYKIMKDLGLDSRKLEETYYIKEVKEKIDIGKTPTSNSQILKQLQMIVDSIIYEADGDKNAYKVTSHDVEYVVKTMTRRGRESGTVVSPRPQTMHMLIMDVLHRIITDGNYKVEYGTKKEAKKAEEAIKTNIFECVEADGFWIVNGDTSYSIEYYKTADDAIAEYKKEFERASA